MNAAELPDSTTVYVPDFGETTAGALRSPLESVSESEDATIRMWLWVRRHAPRAKPWQTGHIRVGGREHPVSVFTSERFLPISTLNGMFKGVDFNEPLEITRRVQELQKKGWR